MSFRDPLAAALARTEAAEARATAAEAALARAAAGAATPARRWAVLDGWGPLALIIASNTTSSLVWIATRGWSRWRLIDVAAFVVSTGAWALAFVRRVPVDGGGR